MKRFYLDNGFDDDFLLYGLVTQEKSHRLAWCMNHYLDYGFTRKDDIVFYNGDQEEAYYSRFDHNDEINRLDYFLLTNKDDGQTLIPELRNIDYFVVIKGALEYFKKKKFTSDVNSLGIVQLVTEISHETLKSKQNLIIPEL